MDQSSSPIFFVLERFSEVIMRYTIDNTSILPTDGVGTPGRNGILKTKNNFQGLVNNILYTV